MQEQQQKKTSTWQLAGLVLVGTIFATWVLLPGDSTPPGLVKAADFGDKWPLNASEATLGCEPPTKAYVEIAGRRCGLNGKALRAGFDSCDNAAKNGDSLSITRAFIDQALMFCATRQ